MVTMRDVAVEAGVSPATVSRALSGDPRVNPDNLRRVQAAAEALRYVPNALGRSLRQQTTYAWTLIIADIENPFLTTVTRGIEDVAQSAGYSVLLGNSDENPEKERNYLTIAEQTRAAGVLLTPTSADVDVHRLVAQGTPVVTLDRPMGPATGIDAVLVDTRVAARQAVTTLIKQGRQHIGCATGPQNRYTAQERAAGYREALQACGTPVDETLIAYGDFKVTGGRTAAETLLTTHPEIDALFIANSLMTAGALDVLAHHHLHIGEDIGLACFDDSPWTSTLGHGVILISQPAYDMGTAAARLLLDRIEHGRRAPQTITLSATMHIEESTPGK